MTTYAEQVRPYINFTTKDEMDKHFNLFRKKHHFDISEKENHVLFTLNGRAFKYPGACKIELEKLAKAAGVSLTTVKNAIRKAVNFGMLKRFKTRKKNGSRQGVTVYQFQHFLPENCPLDGDYSQINEKPCERNGKELFFKPYALILLLPSLKTSLKDITYPAKDGTISVSPVLEEAEKPVSLRQKMARQLKARGLSLTTLNEFAMIAYGQVKKLLKQDASIPKLYAEDLVYKKFLFVIGNPKTKNPFGLLSHVIEKEFAKLLGQDTGKKSELELQVKRGALIEQVPQFMIDAAADPVEKAKLIQQNELAKQQHNARNSKEIIPNWFGDRNKPVQAPVSVIDEPVVDFEAERQRILAKLELL